MQYRRECRAYGATDYYAEGRYLSHSSERDRELIKQIDALESAKYEQEEALKRIERAKQEVLAQVRREMRRADLERRAESLTSGDTQAAKQLIREAMILGAEYCECSPGCGAYCYTHRPSEIVKTI